MTNSNDTSSNPKKFTAWEGSSAFVEQGKHWSSAFIWLTASLFGCSFIWLCTSKVDQTISVRGQLQPSGSVREIDSPSTGVVLDVFVSDGVQVLAGQSLLTVEASALNARIKAIEQSLQLIQFEALAYQTIIDADGIPDLFPPLPLLPVLEDVSLRNKMLASRNQTQQTRSQLTQLAFTLASKKESLRLRNKINDDLKPLFERGGMARNAYFEQLNLSQELNAEVAGLVSERSRIVGSVVAQLNNINRQSITLRAELAANSEALSYRTIKAPISGTIFDLKASTSSYVTNSQPLMKIVPDNKLEAVIQIPNTDIGFVKVGQLVSVSVDSFPSGEFGYIKGSLQSYGSDILPADRDSPFQYFPAVVSLTQQNVVVGKTPLNLQSGMGITANIKLRSRRAITLLTDIFTKQLDGVKRFR